MRNRTVNWKNRGYRTWFPLFLTVLCLAIAGCQKKEAVKPAHDDASSEDEDMSYGKDPEAGWTPPAITATKDDLARIYFTESNPNVSMDNVEENGQPAFLKSILSDGTGKVTVKVPPAFKDMRKFVVTPDGRYLIFLSLSSRLNDSSRKWDFFGIYDQKTGETDTLEGKPNETESFPRYKEFQQFILKTPQVAQGMTSYLGNHISSIEDGFAYNPLANQIGLVAEGSYIRYNLKTRSWTAHFVNGFACLSSFFLPSGGFVWSSGFPFTSQESVLPPESISPSGQFKKLQGQPIWNSAQTSSDLNKAIGLVLARGDSIVDGNLAYFNSEGKVKKKVCLHKFIPREVAVSPKGEWVYFIEPNWQRTIYRIKWEVLFGRSDWSVEDLYRQLQVVYTVTNTGLEKDRIANLKIVFASEP